MDYSVFDGLECMRERIKSADYMDVKMVEGTASLRGFVASVLSYRPLWVQALYKVRRWTLKVMGFEVDLTHADDVLTEETLTITPGEHATFFNVEESDGQTYWVASAPESHLDAVLAVVAEPVDGGEGVCRFHTLTTVHCHNFMGKLEYNMVRPFHHLLLALAVRKSADVSQ